MFMSQLHQCYTIIGATSSTREITQTRPPHSHTARALDAMSQVGASMLSCRTASEQVVHGGLVYCDDEENDDSDDDAGQLQQEQDKRVLACALQFMTLRDLHETHCE